MVVSLCNFFLLYVIWCCHGVSVEYPAMFAPDVWVISIAPTSDGEMGECHWPLSPWKIRNDWGNSYMNTRSIFFFLIIWLSNRSTDQERHNQAMLIFPIFLKVHDSELWMLRGFCFEVKAHLLVWLLCSLGWQSPTRLMGSAGQGMLVSHSQV